MTDAFEQLGLLRRLDLSEEELRSAFREAGKRVHPDAGGSDTEFSKLQEAFTLLSSPSRRLKHWLVLQGVAGDERGSISPELMDLFTQVGGIVQPADELIRQREAALSVLGKAMLEGRTQQTRESLERMQTVLDEAIAAKSSAFPEVGVGTADGWQLTRDLAFLEKWQAQLRERYGKLW